MKTKLPSLHPGHPGQTAIAARSLHCIVKPCLSLRFLVAVFLSAIILPATAQKYLVKDINLTEVSESEFGHFADVNGTLYFSVRGNELWKTEGTEESTLKLKTFSGLYRFANVSGTLFFTANNPVTGTELWKSDGTAEGTVQVKDIRPGADSSNPDHLTNVGGILYFTAHDGATGIELWKSDGTAAGTQRVKDIMRVVGSSNPSNLVALNNKLYFVANDGVNGYELWTSDGTTGGTVIVKDIRTGHKISSNPSLLTEMNGALYFIAADVSSEKHLWRSDGSANGTVKVKDIWIKGDASGAGHLAQANGLLYFMGYDSAHGNELWASDGTTAGTYLVKDITPGPGNQSGYAISHLASFTGIGNLLYFLAYEDFELRLWRSDGTEGGTFPVTDSDNAHHIWIEPYLTDLNGEAYFVALENSTGEPALWKSGGTPATTHVLRFSIGQAYLGENRPTSSGNYVYFPGLEQQGGGYKLWKTHGTSDGTSIVADPFKFTDGSSPNQLTTSGEGLFFRAFDGTHNGLWKTDGSEAGTVVLKAGESGDQFDQLTDVDGILYFSAYNEWDLSYELWKSDGTSGGTELVKAVNDDLLLNFTNVNGTLYFSSFNGLWKSNGTEAGTTQVSTSAGDVSLFRNVNGTLFFTGFDHVNGTELWKSDGTEAGTAMIKDISSGAASSDITNPVALGSVLYFLADDGVHGDELWRSDGTAAGTYMVKDIRQSDPGNIPSNVDIMTLSVWNGTLFFAAQDAASQWGLWKSDGTEAGTVKVTNTSVIDAVMMGGPDAIYFMQPNPSARFDLWRSDGTAAGTYKVTSLDVWADDYKTFHAQIHDGVLYFWTAFRDIWRTDGTACGTFKVLSWSDVNEFRIMNASLYFDDSDIATGRELFALDIDDITTPPCTAVAARTASGLREPGVDEEEMSSFASVSLYPNPFGREITINVAGDDGSAYQASILNLNGVTLEKYHDLQCNMDYVVGSTCPGGMFVLQITRDGKRTVRKIVKRN